MKLDILPTLSGESTTPPLVEAQTDRFTVVADSSNTQQLSTKKKSFGAVFGSTFLTIFLAEFGDKTQLSTLLMSAESQSPWSVFLGSAAALIATSLLGVLLGHWLANRVAPKKIETLAGVSLLLISITLFWDVMQF